VGHRPEQVIKKLVQSKQAADLNTAAFNQMVAYEVGKDGFLDEHVKTIRAVYKERGCDDGDDGRNVSPCVTGLAPWRMFLWGILPEDMDAADVLKIAIERKSLLPGEASTRTVRQNTMRLNFSTRP